METVAHDDRTTAYRQVPGGDGPVVCYVHGSGGTHQAWGRQYTPDGPGGTAVALDLSGHGESDDVATDPGPATLAAYAADLAAVARATDADLLVGSSLGGAVVLHAVLEGLARPDALVLTGSGAKLAVDEDLRALLATDFEAALDVLNRPDTLFHDPDPTLRERTRTAMRAVGQRVLHRDFLTSHAFDVRDRLGDVTVPTLAVCGEHDGLTPPAYHEYIAEHVPEGRAVTVPGAAHLVMLERPGAFNRAIEEFLDSLQS